MLFEYSYSFSMKNTNIVCHHISKLYQNKRTKKKNARIFFDRTKKKSKQNHFPPYWCHSINELLYLLKIYLSYNQIFQVVIISPFMVGLSSDYKRTNNRDRHAINKAIVLCTSCFIAKYAVSITRVFFSLLRLIHIQY